MHWHSSLSGHGFREWLLEVSGSSRIGAGTPLDPFTTSNRRLLRVSDWLSQIHDTGKLELDRGRVEQSIVDLGRAGLAGRDQGRVYCTDLGERVLTQWINLDIANNDENFELPRALVLAKSALDEQHVEYETMWTFWQELRKVYDVDSLFENPAALYLVSYLNQDVLGFNPWKVVAVSTSRRSLEGASNWDDLLNHFTSDPEVSTAVENLRKRIQGWASRASGRIDFCRAMELMALSIPEAKKALQRWEIDADAANTCLLILEKETNSAADKAGIEELVEVMQERKNVILFGPPGTGKTRSAFALSDYWKAVNGPDTVIHVTFHPSYSYEDFIQGYRPDPEAPSTFKLQDGILLLACEAARREKMKSPDNPGKVLLVIDEINRGDTARIFGELITYIEPDKRDRPAHLSQNAASAITVPSNLFFLGTMNTADKSISLLDVALRRRFAFMEYRPDSHAFGGIWHAEIAGVDIGNLLNALNVRLLESGIEPDRAIGHALLGVPSDSANPVEALKRLFRFDILPLVTEYCYADRTMVRRILGDLTDNSGRWRELAKDEFLATLRSFASTSEGQAIIR